MKIKLRKLQLSDLEYMQEYYIEEEIAKNLNFTKSKYDENISINFILNSISICSIHLAIEVDLEYAGTISLKNISFRNSAEYAIVVRKKFWGKNISFIASKLILDYGFDDLNLKSIYLFVLASNLRANSFYKKINFKQVLSFEKYSKETNSMIEYNKYSIKNNKV